MKEFTSGICAPEPCGRLSGGRTLCSRTRSFGRRTCIPWPRRCSAHPLTPCPTAVSDTVTGTRILDIHFALKCASHVMIGCTCPSSRTARTCICRHVGASHHQYLWWRFMCVRFCKNVRRTRRCIDLQSQAQSHHIQGAAQRCSANLWWVK